MKLTCISLLVICLNIWISCPIFSQCTPDRSDDCDGASVLCGLSAMNGYSCKNADYPNMSGPPSLCPGWGAPTNIGWWAFVSSGGNVCITVTYNNCTFPPPGGTNGIQLGIYGDCSFNDLIICDATCPGPVGTKTICANLIACKTYYFFVDGCNGDVCDFILQTSGGAAPQLDPIGKINNDPDRIIEVCKGACKINFEVKPQNGTCEATYSWTLDGVDLGKNTNKINLDFPDEGSFILCATAIIGTASSICDKEGPECATIVVKKVADKKGGPYRICTEKLPYMWHQQIVDASGTYRNEFRDPNCCYFDSVVDFIILPIPITPTYYFIGCGPNDVYKDQITGRVFNSCQNETTLFLKASTTPYLCDSSYNLTAVFLKFNVQFLERCIGEEIEISPIVINQSGSCGGGETYAFSYKWYLKSDMTKKSIGTDEKLVINTKNDYCLELIIDTRLGAISKSCSFEFCELIDEDQFKLNSICPIGDTISCAGNIKRYSIDSNLSKDFIFNIWTVTNGTILTANPSDTNIIDVKWSNVSDTGKICYSYITSCGTSPECCLDIDINSAPNGSAGKDQVICGLSGNLNGVKDFGGTWKFIGGPGKVTFQDSTNEKSALTVDQFGDYYFIWEENQFSCTSIDTVLLAFKPEPFKSIDYIICSGNNADYKIKFQILGGSVPYIVQKGNGTIDASNNYISGIILNNIKDTIIISDINGCTFSYIHDYECKCTNQIGNLDSLPQDLCQDEILHILYDTTGQRLDLVPADTLIFFIYTNLADPFGSKIRNIGSLDLVYDASLLFNQFYYVGAYLGRKNGNGGIDNNLGCVRLTNQAKMFRFFQIPIPNAGIDTSVCGTTFKLNAQSSIIGSKITWKVISGGGILFSDPNSLQTDLTIQGNYGSYVVEIEEDNQGICKSTDRIEIVFNPTPDIVQVDKICVELSNPGRYIVKADIQGGTAPYKLVSTGGKIVNNQWCSDTLISLTPFDLEIIDANGCRSTPINDNHNCNCGIINAGQLDSVVTVLCEDECITVKNLIQEQINPAEDVAMYILHKGFYKNAIDTFYFLNDIICFNPLSMQLGGNNVYYISRVVGNDLAPKDGIVDDQDPCLRVSNNQPVSWIPYPIADAGKDLKVCGKQVNLLANLNFGIGQWSILSGAGNLNFSDPNLANSNVQVNQFGSYSLLWKVINGLCSRSDTLNIVFLDEPEFLPNSISYECDLIAENYRFKIDAQFGERSSWNVLATYNSNIFFNGQFNNQQWQSDWIPTGSIFNLKISDNNRCDTNSFAGKFDCPCLTQFGILDKTPIVLCEGMDAKVNYNGSNGVLDANDEIRYVLYDGLINDPKNGIVINTNKTGIFSFDPTKMQLNKKYFVAVFVGNIDASSGNTLLSDRCLKYDIVEITWFAKPLAMISGSKILNCNTALLILDGSNSTTGSSSPAQYLWTSTNGRFVDPTQTQTDKVSIDLPGTYTLEVTDPLTGCKNSMNWDVGIDITKPIVLIDPAESLTCEKSKITIRGNKSSQGAPFLAQWSGPGILGSSNGVQIDIKAIGRYTLKITNSDNGCTDSISVDIKEDKVFPKSIIQASGDLTCAINQIQLNGSGSFGNSGTISNYQWSAINGSITSGQNTNKIIVGKPGGIYVLTIKDDKNGCENSDTITIAEIGNPLRDFSVKLKDPLCFGDKNGEIELDGVIDVNNQNITDLEYSFNGSVYGARNIYIGLSKGTYSITAKDKNGCLLSKSFSLVEPPKLSLTVVRQIIVNQGDLVRLDSLLLSINGGTTLNGMYKDTLWFNTNDQIDWESFLTYTADKNRDFVVTAIDQSDCIYTDQIKIIVRVLKDIWWPSVFSPNQDGTNDFFILYGKRIKQIKTFNIFDRWGSRVYTANNLQDGNSGSIIQGWDGKIKGEAALPGVYTFYAEVEFLDNSGVETVAGNVTLLR
ncbi:MAG: gliding motility-associated C-terminal domain-containing protein [Saprospiraceae bacterium]